MTNPKQKARGDAIYEAGHRVRDPAGIIEAVAITSIPVQPASSPEAEFNGVIIPMTPQDLARLDEIEALCSNRPGAKLLVLFGRNRTGND